jgi:membrane protease YdiL (CAAX protease family)
MARMDKSAFDKIIAYLIITYAISWVFWGLVIILNNYYAIKFNNPIITILWTIGGFGPTISPIILMVTWKKINNIKGLLKFIFYSPKFNKTIIITLVMIIIQFLIMLIFCDKNKNFHFYMLLINLPGMIIYGGLEEIGWRGLLQPYLEKICPFLVSILLVSIIWTSWHIPLFLINGSSQNDMNILIFFFGNFSLTCILAMIHKITKNVFSCILFHAWSNVLYSIFEINMNTGFIFSYISEIIISVTICLLINKRILKL